MLERRKKERPLKKEQYPRGWSAVVIYAAVIIPISYSSRIYEIAGFYQFLLIVCGIVTAELIYRAYQKWISR